MNCFCFFTYERKIINIMKKNFIAGVIVSLAMVGMFGGVSFAADKAPDAKPAVAAVAAEKAEAPAPVAKKVVKKKVSKKKVKKAVAKKVEAKKVEAPAAK
jgi:hypothetical protein